jgi:hypothetical protein
VAQRLGREMQEVSLRAQEALRRREGEADAEAAPTEAELEEGRQALWDWQVTTPSGALDPRVPWLYCSWSLAAVGGVVKSAGLSRISSHREGDAIGVGENFGLARSTCWARRTSAPWSWASCGASSATNGGGTSTP